MKIKDKPDFNEKPKPICFAPGDSVRKALNVMCKKNIGSVIITHPDETIAGIVTERDMMIRVLGKDKDPDKTKLSDIMSKKIRAAKEDDDLLDWMQIMSQERFRHLPVVDQDGKLVNMMSQGDFVAYTWPDLFEKVKKDLKDRLGSTFQGLLFIFAIVTIILIAMGM